MKGVILAAGKGTRMREITNTIPKPLLLLANRPILEHTIDSLRNSGIKELLIIVKHMKEQIIDYFGNGKEFGVNITYVEQHDMLGTGDAAKLARDFANDDDFLLIFSDIVTPPSNIPGIVETFSIHRPFMVLAVRTVDDPFTGAAVYVEEGVVKKIIEKPPKGTSTTNYDNAGIFVFSKGVFELLDQLKLSPRGEYELTDAIQMSIERELEVRAYEIHGYWSNVSSPEDLIKTNALVLRDLQKTHIVDPLAEIGEACLLGPNVSVAEKSVLGNEVIAKNSAINRNSVIGDGAVLDYVYIRDNSTIKPGISLIGKPEEIIIV